jgi:hypothetical protein
VATLVARNAIEAMAAVSAFDGSLESGGPFRVGAFGGNVTSVAAKLLSHLIYFMRKLINVVLLVEFAEMVLQ